MTWADAYEAHKSLPGSALLKDGGGWRVVPPDERQTRAPWQQRRDRTSFQFQCEGCGLWSEGKQGHQTWCSDVECLRTRARRRRRKQRAKVKSRAGGSRAVVAPLSPGPIS